MLISLEEFRSLVNGMMPQISKSADPEAAKAFVGMQDTPNYQCSVIGDVLFARIKESFRSGHQKVFNHCRTLLAQLVHDHEAADAALNPYFEVLSVMRDAIRSNAYEVEVEGNWGAAVQSAMDFAEWRGPMHMQMYEYLFKAEIEQARAIRRVMSVGKGRKVKKGTRDIPEGKRRALARTIEWKFIRHMGGEYVAGCLFSMLAPTYDNDQERYHVVDNVSVTQPHKPRLPLGLLLNYAAKYPLATRPMRRNDSDWQHLVRVSKDFATVYGVQAASKMEIIFTNQEGLLPLLRKLSIRDALFSPQQARPSDIVRILRGLMAGLRSAEKLPEHAASEADDLIKVISALQTVIGNNRGPCKIDAAQVAAACTSLSESRVRELLREALAHREGTANKHFTIPDEIPNEKLPRDERAGPNLGDRPLLTLRKDRYLLLDHSINAPAMIEAVLSRLRTIGLDADIGYGIEGLLHNEFSGKGVQTKTGKYQAGAKKWECDVVIETSKRVVFLETKKKSLTRAARAGLDAALLIDMTDSLVSATLQAKRHQRQLQQAGFLELEQADGSISRVDLNGREVECIAFTLPDYGSFQDRLVHERVLNSGMRIDFSTTDVSFKKKITTVNDKLQELREVNNDLYVQAGKPANWHCFFNSWFLSVPQILVLLDGVENVEDFERALMLTRHISTGNNDFYFDVHYAKKLRDHEV